MSIWWAKTPPRRCIRWLGGGIPGRYWIDLGFDDSNYESWHFWTTLYFLTPVPGYIPVVLP